MLFGELQAFVTDGEYGRGLARLVEAYLAALGRGDQGVRGFPGFTARASRISPRCCARCGPTSSFPTGPKRAVSSTKSGRIRGQDRASCAPPRRAGAGFTPLVNPGRRVRQYRSCHVSGRRWMAGCANAWPRKPWWIRGARRKSTRDSRLTGRWETRRETAEDNIAGPPKQGVDGLGCFMPAGYCFAG
jgi:hypothetical protein